MSEHPSVIIGKYLREERKKKNLSLTSLEKLCDMSSSQISVIERGINTGNKKYISITLSSLELIGKGLGLTVQEILENSGYHDYFNESLLSSQKSLSTHIQKILKSNYPLLNEENKEKILSYIEALSKEQKKEYENSSCR